MTRGHELAMALRAAYWAMHRRADALFGRFGVTADQFVLLSFLNEEDGISQQELVRRATSDANTVRAMLLLLEHRGLVSRRPHVEDGRAHSVTLTALGRRTYLELVSASDPFRTKLLASLARHEVPVLIDMLARLTAAMPRGEPIVPPARGRRRSRRGRNESRSTVAALLVQSGLRERKKQ